MPQWVSRLFSRSAPAMTAVQAHITFGATSVGRTFSRTSLLLKKQLWIWPIIAIVMLAIVGFAMKTAIEGTIRQHLIAHLQTLLNVERAMLETWLKVQESNAESLANNQNVREIATEIASLGEAELLGPTGASEGAANIPRPIPREIHVRLMRELGPAMSAHGFVSYLLADKEHRIASSANPELIGKTIGEYEWFLSRALEGKAVVCPPFSSVALLKDDRGQLRTGVPTMFVAAPVRDQNLQIVAAIAFRIRPEREFTRILQLGQAGVSGETYAIDKTGLLVSSSRFDEQLILLGLLPDAEGSRSLLTLSARDPGGDLTEGYRPGKRRAELPLTKAAASAVAGEAGIDVDGYNDYRGVPVVGAWHWFPDYSMGLITEVDHAEAYYPLTILRWAFFSMFGLLTLTSIAIFVFTLFLARAQREAQIAVIEAKHLGQYRLQERIGAGAMGVVYKGHHAMLRRATAIKMLDVDKVNEASIQRFEREVQITCLLNHPNTVAIYDYGRTPEGVFYYAMEFLDGIELQALVDRYGPQSEGRVIRILKQICGSLYEAHSMGLVHRDVKPGNVMLNRRGGEPDVAKVLDFGLVRALNEARESGETGGLSGTPLYMSPEAFQTPDRVDARSDIYAVGAIGYFLITGQPVFTAPTLVDLCHRHVVSIPDTPSQRLGREISGELESALLACLEKDRAKRPQTARDLAALLDRAPTAHEWTLDEAEAWWRRHARSVAQNSDASRSDTAIGPGNVLATLDSNASRGTRTEIADTGRTSSSAFDQTISTDTGNGSGG